MTLPDPADLAAAATAVDLAQELVEQACASIRGRGGIDANQVVAYDVSHAAAAVGTARAALEYGEHGSVEAAIASAFVADVVADLAGKVAGREALWGVEPGWVTPVSSFLEAQRDPSVLAALASTEGPRHLGEDFELVRETFHRFAEDKVRPHAEHVHRTNADIPEDVIEGLAELGGFGLSVPEEYGGYASGGESDYMGMVVATEELSWGSLGVGGSLITRPEILTRALVYGGTQEQKKQWLPRLATAEVLAAVAVTEPDYGS
ncbi:MAG TPA: acyl-CoA dehydrogenase family protein, partial [Acidimicrobiales bacterium]|nr:acyl-CoA dehydrogenase family protein [Acidimicrobiales bacterium]